MSIEELRLKLANLGVDLRPTKPYPSKRVHFVTLFFQAGLMRVQWIEVRRKIINFARTTSKETGRIQKVKTTLPFAERSVLRRSSDSEDVMDLLEQSPTVPFREKSPKQISGPKCEIDLIKHDIESVLCKGVF